MPNDWFEHIMNMSAGDKRSFLAFCCGYSPETMETMFANWKDMFGV